MISSSILLLLAFVSRGLGSQLEPRIVGGRDIDIEVAPWQVSLQVNDEHYCGGSLYSDRIVITAAHCFYENLGNGEFRPWHTKQFLIVAGSAIKRYRKFFSGVSAIRQHEKYNSYTLEHDIGIMKLSKPFSFSNQIQPIQLAMEDPDPRSVVLSTGWGQINKKGPGIPNIFPENLQGINLYINYISWCKKFALIPMHTICAGVPGKSICFGDSGGPLVFNNTLVGVVSAVNEECFGPTVYISVAHHYGWLRNAIISISRRKVRSGNGKMKVAHKLT